MMSMDFVAIPFGISTHKKKKGGQTTGIGEPVERESPRVVRKRILSCGSDVKSAAAFGYVW
jgi:hypothetical protein